MPATGFFLNLIDFHHPFFHRSLNLLYRCDFNKFISFGKQKKSYKMKDGRAATSQLKISLRVLPTWRSNSPLDYCYRILCILYVSLIIIIFQLSNNLFIPLPSYSSSLLFQYLHRFSIIYIATVEAVYT